MGNNNKRPIARLTQNPCASFLRKLGPGLITGASDDDPSGIGTYSQVGAQFGFELLWTQLLSLPLMAAIQEICARIGRVTGVGIAANMRRHYPRSLLYAMVTLLCAANIFNLGADLGAMGAAVQLLVGGPLSVYVLFFALLCLSLEIYTRYRTYVRYLKWLTVALFAYILTAFLIRVPWLYALRASVVPHLALNRSGFMALTALLGTSISPYLFFWQASQEAENLRAHSDEHPLKRAPWEAPFSFDRIHIDTYAGMGFSNLVAWFIILTTAAALHSAGILDIQTSAQAAKALEPLAGRFAFILFAVGIIGTGLLAVPVLAGSAGYCVAEAFRWRASLQRRPAQAKRFYGVVIISMLIGLALNFAGIDPMRSLYWAAVLNGIIAAPIMAVTMLAATSEKVMGEFTLPPPLKIVGWIATLLMLLTALGLLFSLRG